MICSKLLMPLLDGKDYEIFPLMRTIEFTVYIKVSKIKHKNETACLDNIRKITDFDKLSFANLNYIKGEYFLAQNEHFDIETDNKWAKWNYKNDEINYAASEFILRALENLYDLLNKKNLENKTLILFVLEIGNNHPYYIYCDPILAKNELNFLYEKTANDAILISATDNYVTELPKANNSFLDMQNPTTKYLTNQLSLFVLKVIDIIKNKLKILNKN